MQCRNKAPHNLTARTPTDTRCPLSPHLNVAKQDGTRWGRNGRPRDATLRLGVQGGSTAKSYCRLAPLRTREVAYGKIRAKKLGRLARGTRPALHTCTWWSRESFPPSTVTEWGKRSRLMRQCWGCFNKLHHVTVHKSPSSPRAASSAQRASHHHAAPTIINTLGTTTRTSNMQNAKKTATTAFTTKHQQHPHQHHHPGRHHHYEQRLVRNMRR